MGFRRLSLGLMESIGLYRFEGGLKWGAIKAEYPENRQHTRNTCGLEGNMSNISTWVVLRDSCGERSSTQELKSEQFEVWVSQSRL